MTSTIIAHEIDPAQQLSLNNALMSAIKSKDTSAVKKYLLDGADPNSRNNDYGDVALLKAMTWSWYNDELDCEIIDILMAKGADPNIVFSEDVRKVSPFMSSCMSGMDKTIIMMLNSSCPVKVNILADASDQISPAMMIASRCSVEVMYRAQKYFEENVLANQGPQDQMERGHLWLTPNNKGINAFLYNSSVDGKRWILDQNFMDSEKLIESVDFEGKTALWQAVSNVCVRSVELLLGRGAKVNAHNLEGLSLLEIAEKRASRSISANPYRILSSLLAVDASQKAMAAIDEVVGHHQAARP